jgi:hypothetical protein
VETSEFKARRDDFVKYLKKLLDQLPMRERERERTVME